METIIYKIEISSLFGIIYTMTSKGLIIETQEVSPSRALSFAHTMGLAFMEDDGDAKYYW